MVIYKNLLDNERSKRLEALINAAKKNNSQTLDDLNYYEDIYYRRENFDTFYKRRNINTNEKIEAATKILTTTENYYKSPAPKTELEKKAAYYLTKLYPDPLKLFAATADNIYSSQKNYVIEKHLNKQLRDIFYYQTLYETIKIALRQGTCYQYIKWNYRTVENGDQSELVYLNSLLEKYSTGELSVEVQTEIMRLQMAMSQKQMQGNSVLIDRPEVEIVTRHSLFIDPTASSIENAEYVVLRRFAPLSRLRDYQEMGRLRNVELLNEKGAGVKSSMKDMQGTREQKISSNKLKTNNYDPIVEYEEIHEKGGFISIRTVTEGVLLDYRRQVYQIGALNFPFVEFKNNPEANKLFGESAYSANESLINVSDVLQKYLIEATSRHIQGRTFISGPNITDENLKKKLERGEGGIITVKQINGIVNDRVPMPDGTSYLNKDRLDAQIKDNLGVNNTAGGETGASNLRTDGTMAAYMQNAQAGLSTGTIMFSAPLKKLGRLFLALNRQFLLEPQIYTYTYGKEYYFNQKNTFSQEGNFEGRGTNPVPPAYSITGLDIPIDFDVNLNLKTEEESGKRNQISDMREFIQIASAYPFFRIDRALAELAAKMGGFDDPLSLLDPDYSGIVQRDKSEAESVGNQAKPMYSGGMTVAKAAQMQQSRQNEPISAVQQAGQSQERSAALGQQNGQ